MPASHTTSRSGDGTVTLTPRNEASQTASVIISHGLGDSADGFVDVAEHLAQKLPYARFILPTAARRPVTLNGGMRMAAWYDIKGLDLQSNQVCDGMEESRKRIEGMIRSELDRGIKRNRIVLAGFSMGGALSLFTGMGLPTNNGEPPLAGIAVMSGYLAHESGFRVSPGLEGTPIWHGHGTADPMLPIIVAEMSRKRAMERGARDYTLVPYSGVAHTCSPAEIVDLCTFLVKVLPPSADDGLRVKLKDPGEMSVKELKRAIASAGLGRQAVGLMEKGEFVDLLRRHQQGKL